jgi:hypothetical protein
MPSQPYAAIPFSAWLNKKYILASSLTGLLIFQGICHLLNNSALRFA